MPDQSRATIKILVVDDSAIMRKLIARSLDAIKSEAVDVVQASDGVEALAMVQRHGRSIDLILCDMNMPNLNGLSLLRSLRGSPELRQIPFVVVTADESDESTARALREGAAGVIGKPFRPEVIADIVRRRRSGGSRVASSAFKTDTITRMIRTMSRSARDAPEDPDIQRSGQRGEKDVQRDARRAQAEARERGRDVPDSSQSSRR